MYMQLPGCGHEVSTEMLRIAGGICPTCQLDEDYFNHTLNYPALWYDSTPENLKEAANLKPRILQMVQMNAMIRRRTSMAEIYRLLQCWDVPMYMAVHALIQEGKIVGEDPYAWNGNNHDEMWYEL